MSLWPAIRDNAIKWFIGVVGGGIVTAGIWAFNNVVTRDSLAEFAVMIGEEVRDELAPITLQVESNTLAICTSRRSDLRAQIRDLKVEIAEMERDQFGPEWGNRESALLAEWREDYDAAYDELSGLGC